jgi:hypothetical protein
MGAYHKIYDIQRQLLVFFYIFFCLTLMLPGGMLIDFLFSPHWAVYIFAAVLYLVLCIIAGAYIFVITLLPVKLMRGFDHIQNNIADGSINTDEQFAIAVNKFVIQYFNYLFFDIEQSAFYIDETAKLFNSDGFPKPLLRLNNEFIEKSSKTPEVYYHGKHKLDNIQYHYYVVPVWFNTQYLGYMLFGTRNKLSRFFIGFLHDFETLFIDDQLLHIVNRIKRKQS